MRSNNLTVLAVIGVGTALVLAFFMLFFLRALERSPQAETVKLGLEAATRFEIAGVRFATASRGVHGEVVRVEYRTDRVLRMEEEQREMAEVARFVHDRLPKLRRDDLDRIEVRRHWVRGSGCFQRSAETSLEWQPPEEPPPESHPPDAPEPR